MMVNISIGTAALAAFLGYLVDFVGIILLMVVFMIVGKIIYKGKKAEEVVDLGSIEIPQGIEAKKIAVILSVIAQEAGWGNVAINARRLEQGKIDPKVVAAIISTLSAAGEA